MFESVGLSLVYCLPDVFPFFSSLAFSQTKLIFAYVSLINPHILKLSKFRETRRGTKISLRYIATDIFDGVGGVKVAPKARFVAAFARNGRKINIYSVRTYKIKKVLENQDGEIKNISFDSDCKYLAVMTATNTVNIYNLFPNKTNTKKKVHHKNARNFLSVKSFSESYISNSEISLEKNAQNEGIFRYIKHKIGSISSSPYCHIKEKRFSGLEFISIFFAQKHTLTLLTKDGRFFEVKINSKKGENYKIVRSGVVEGDVEE